ncbi:hypothetical protein AMECASPLE_033423 [Ameca splendens]|uniref:Uncharacterized protein n=1 Tax=Ameca splendens TaxID=208324 RepID=A0ABV1AE66_9TELE
MLSSSGKRKSSGKSARPDVGAVSNALIDTCPDYATGSATPRLSLMDEEIVPPLPVTHEKPYVKKAKSDRASADIVATFSKANKQQVRRAEIPDSGQHSADNKFERKRGNSLQPNEQSEG